MRALLGSLNRIENMPEFQENLSDSINFEVAEVADGEMD